MKLARTLQLPTGMAMTFVCSPTRSPGPAQDPAAQAQQWTATDPFAPMDPPAEDWDELKRPR